MKSFILRTCTALALFAMLAAAHGCRNTPAEPEVDNIILMIGDGMGLAHVTALMIENEYAPINIERTQFGGFVKTYSANNRVTDSAASATAYATGEKTRNSYLGVDTLGRPLETILEKGVKKGMSAGLVASIGLPHATPGAFYGHCDDRGEYFKIARDLLDADIDVAIGGGRKYFENRPDSLDIIAALQAKGYTIADNLEGLEGVSEGKAMAVYPGNVYAMPYIVNGRDPEYLAKATGKALEILENNSRGKGFFLMVEGSQIDGMAHENNARGMLAEMRDFDDAVGVAIDFAETRPGTLVIVLADHETGGLTIPSGNADFLRAESGIDFRWGTGSHTGSMIPLFAYGPRAEYFSGVLENCEVGRRMQQVLGLE